ncbi:MAG: MiaB/RimO family radical SAM methylthiotransferase [Planctomycetota bacterium]|nr:MiaB/RimO family radical SAM methylthiotransferase [Planctomycetota bacterium]
MSTEHPPAGTVARSVYLETFGCQMNVLDSELVRGQLAALGYEFTDDPTSAAVVLYNTCSVREQAENKVLSRVGRIGVWKKRGHKVILGVIGCLAEREGSAMLRKYPQIDLMCGPGELDNLPMLIDNAMKTEAVALADRVALQGNKTRRWATLAAAEDNLELLDLSRSFDPDRASAGGRSAYVRITRGCNKFCTYCVVPYTRGAEVHRPPDHIVDECKRLADLGVIEITLLGQTVNHYAYTHGLAVTVNGTEAAQVGPGLSGFRNGGAKPQAARRVTSFADLLARIHDEVTAVKRLRFVTSYPRDFGTDILQVMQQSPRICRYLHVPAQSGSNRILKLMNRGYSREHYVEFIDRARAALPDVSIAGDIIVGFPTETDADFEMTKDLLRRVRFKNNFIFKYSPRPGTAAIARLGDDVPSLVKRRRNRDLLALGALISAEVHAEYVGRVEDVFVQKVSEKTTGRSAPSGGQVQLGWETPPVQMSGRTGGDLITVFDVPASHSCDDLVGRIIPVRITGSGPLILKGEPVVDQNQGAAHPAAMVDS